MQLRLCVFPLLLALAAGCTPGRGPFGRGPDGPGPGAKPTAAQLVEHLNQNADRIQSIESQNISIEVMQGGQAGGLRGDMAFQKPRDFRLMAYAGASTQADLGSNNQEFWFWIKKSDLPGLIYCSYEDLPQCQGRLPLQPDWIAEALGATRLGPADQYQIRAKGNDYELVTQIAAPDGQTLSKITVVGAAGKTRGKIVSHHLRTAKGEDIWSAHVLDHQDVGGVTLPYRVKIVSPHDKTEMTLRLDRTAVNKIQPVRAKELFARPNMPGVQSVDLARGPKAQPTSIQHIRGASE